MEVATSFTQAKKDALDSEVEGASVLVINECKPLSQPESRDEQIGSNRALD